MAKSKPELKKPAKKGQKKAARKQLQSGIAEKFLDAVTNLGHDAERIAKDIKKISKQLAEKLSEKIKEAKQPEKKAGKKRGKTLLKEIDETPKKAIKISKAAKVVAKVANKGKRQATDRDVIFPKAGDQLKTVRKPAARRGFKATITEDIVAASPAKPVSTRERRAVSESSEKAEVGKQTNGRRGRKSAPDTQANVAASKPTTGRRGKKVASEAQPKAAQTKSTSGRGRKPKVENGAKDVNQEDAARINTEGASTDTANNETTE